MSNNKKKKHKNATAGGDATNQSQESSMRETLNDFAYFQEVWDKSMHPTNTTKKRKSDTKSNMMLHDDDGISTTSSLQSSHFSTSSDGSSIQPKKKRRKSNVNKHHDAVSITNAKDVHKKEEDTKTSNYNTHLPSKKRQGRHTHRQHHNSYKTLYHNMSIAQVDNLVGWAHSHSDNTNSTIAK